MNKRYFNQNSIDALKIKSTSSLVPLNESTNANALNIIKPKSLSKSYLEQKNSELMKYNRYKTVKVKRVIKKYEIKH